MNNTNDDNRVKNIIMSLLFVAFIAVFFVCAIAGESRDFSENENRELAQMPEITAKAVLNGSFSKGFERYVQDQFPGRETMMPLKTQADLFSGKKDNGLVYFGDDGYLFCIEKMDNTQLEKNVGYINYLKKSLDSKLKFKVMVIPTATEILEDKLPANAIVPDEKAAIDLVKEKGTFDFIDVTSVLEAHKDEYIYYRTDHHWTTLGAFYAYQVWSGNRHDIEDYTVETVSEDFCGTNYSKALLHGIQGDSISKFTLKADSCGYSMKLVENKMDEPKIMNSLYDADYLTKKDKYSYFISGNNPLTVISRTGGAPAGKNILIIKDSFAHCMIPFIASDYDKTVVVDMRYYRNNVSELVAKYGITEVLVVYNILNLSQDKNMIFLKAK